jgi:CRP-like cAMP-binding protein
MSSPILPREGILAFLDDEARRVFVSYGSTLSVHASQVVIAEGVQNVRLYLILKGTYHVTTLVEGRPVHFDTLNPGDCFGEVAIFHPDLASATITSLGAGELWSIDSGQLQQFLFDEPEAGCAAVLGIATILSRRLKRADDVIRTNEIVPLFLSVRANKPPTQPLPGSSQAPTK